MSEPNKVRWTSSLVALAVALVLAPGTSVSAQDFPLFVADYQGMGVYSIDGNGNVSVRGVVPGLLNSVREDTDGNLYTCSQDSQSVSRIDPAGSVSVYATGLTSCFGLLFASDGTLYVSDIFAGRLYFVPPGGGPVTTLASGLVGPMHIAPGPGGSLLVTQYLAGQLSRVDPDGTVTTVATGFDHPIGVTLGPDNRYYVSELFNGRITRVDLTGNTALLAVLDGGPAGLDFNQDGRLFIAEFLAGRITTLDVATLAVSVFRGGLGAPVGIAFHRGSSSETDSVINVVVDLKPGTSENSVNPRSNGVVPVAVLSSAEFDATQVDTSSVRFGVTGTEAAPGHSHLEDVNGDGRLDLVMQFTTRDLGISTALPGKTLVPLALTGVTIAGQAIAGGDTATIAGSPK